jgi:hypothetical protein
VVAWTEQYLRPLKDLLINHTFALVNRKNFMTISNASPIAAKIFSIKNLCNELQISRQTIYNWEKLGYITAKRIGGRKFFLGQDIINTLNKSK